MRYDDQMTIGEFNTLLRSADPDAAVYFDWNNMVPTGFGSYRGYYNELALGFDMPGKSSMWVSKLLEDSVRAEDGIFYGYKGGEFQMHRETPLWVANYGQCGGVYVSGIELRHVVIIKTKVGSYD